MLFQPEFNFLFPIILLVSALGKLLNLPDPPQGRQLNIPPLSTGNCSGEQGTDGLEFCRGASATRLASAEIRAWDIRNKAPIPLIFILSLI